MIYVFYGLFILACIVLVIAVLLQPGKADAGALFSGSVNSTAFGARGTATLLQKITIGAAASFFIIALLVSQPAITGTRSTLETTPDTAPLPTPVPAPLPPAPVASPAATTPNPAETTGSPAAPAASPAVTTPPAASSPAASPAVSPAK